MSLKENIERGKQELIRKEQEKKEQERQRIEQERQRVENLKSKALSLDKRAYTLFEPYKSLIESSQCVPLLEELVQLEKLTSRRGGQWPKDAAKPKVNIDVSYTEKSMGSKPYNGELTYYSMTMDDGFYLNLNFGSSKKYGSYDVEDLDGIDPDSLEISKVCISLKWNSYEVGNHIGDDSDGNPIIETEYCGENIDIFFTPSSLQVLGIGEDKIFTKENINKDSLEKSISRAYLNTITY